MTRSKIQKIKFFVFLLIFLLSQITACNGSFREKRKAIESVPSNDRSDKNYNRGAGETAVAVSKNALKDVQNAINNTSANNLKKQEVNITSKAASGAATTTIPPATSTIQSSGGMHIPSMNSGALMRGIFVILGLSVIVMAYMVFRSFRLNKTRAQMVRKYGVLAHRQDVEMRPLPLDEDDDDDTTVFDASNISSHRLTPQDS